MDTPTPQFGIPFAEQCEERQSAYAVIYNAVGQILAVHVANEYHLPGGGIEVGENPKEAIIRESIEEAGAHIKNLEYIGQANLFLDDFPINKLGQFYKAELVDIDPSLVTESSHTAMWMTPVEYLNSNIPEFHKWAVEQTQK